jgi:hypothetical protein
MQEVATGKYHGHSSGGLTGVPPTDEIGPSVLSVPRTDATITLFCCDAVGLQLAHFGHQAAMRRCQLLGVKPTRRDPFPNFSTRFPGFCVGDRVRIRHLRVRILLGQPASLVSLGRFCSAEKATIFLGPGRNSQNLRGEKAPNYCRYPPIWSRSLRSRIFHIHLWKAETWFEFSRDRFDPQ